MQSDIWKGVIFRMASKMAVASLRWLYLNYRTIQPRKVALVSDPGFDAQGISLNSIITLS